MTCCYKHRKKCLAVLQQGDTFPLEFTYKNGDTPMVLDKNCFVKVGLFDEKGKCLVSVTTQSRRMYIDGPNFWFEVSHAESVNMVGYVSVEVALINREKIYHASEKVYIYFEPRNLNNE